MTGRTHIAAGIAALWTVAPALPQTPYGAAAFSLLCLGALVGAVVPDLDAGEGTLARFSITVERWTVRPFADPARSLGSALGHRGALHSALGGIALTALAAAITLTIAGPDGIWFAIGFALGLISHLLLDAATVHGIPLWWPGRSRWHLLPPRWRFHTGSPEEDILFVAAASLALLLLLPRLLMSPR